MRYTDVQDVAELLGVSESTVHQWVGRGQSPPSFKVGKHRRFERSDVMAWIEEQKQRARRSSDGYLASGQVSWRVRWYGPDRRERSKSFGTRRDATTFAAARKSGRAGV